MQSGGLKRPPGDKLLYIVSSFSKDGASVKTFNLPTEMTKRKKLVLLLLLLLFF